ncbi:O-antigen ligase family protein [Agromyces sp. NPDC056379]|uniref:O-antigen ligase family protein n=1 Tax=unclassified Agromyces TaxID=2639701 RepID=UPI0035DD81B0
MTSRVGIERRSRTSGDAVTWLSVYVLLLFFIPSKLVVGALGSAGAPSMIFGLVSLVLWFLFRLWTLLRFENPRRRAPARHEPIRTALWIFLFCVGITYAMAMSRPISPDEVSPADVALLAAASWTGTLLIAHDGIPSRDRLESFLWRLAVCGALLAGLGIVQVLTGQAWVDRISIPGLTVTEVPTLFTRGAFPRPSGTAVHPIEYGVLVTMLLPLALYVAFNQVERGWIRWLPAAALAAVIPLTSSRSAYIGAVIGLAIVMLGWPKMRRRVIALIAVGGIAAMSVVTPNLLNSIVNLFVGAPEDPSVGSRTGSFDVAFQFIAELPLFGRGLGTFLPKYRIFDNQYLGLLVTIGIIGTLAFVALGVVAAITMLRLRRASSDDRTRDLALTLVAAISVGFISLSFFDAFAFPMTMGSLFLLLGVCGALYRLEHDGGTARFG